MTASPEAAGESPTHFSRASQPVLPDRATDSPASLVAVSPSPTHFSRASQPVFLVLISYLCGASRLGIDVPSRATLCIIRN